MSKHKHSKKDERKPKKERRRSSSSSSSGSDQSSDLDKKLDKFRDEKHHKRRLARQAAKEHETPEQKRQRRLAKKLLKEERRREASKLVLPESIPYTDHNNPFNDSNLTEVFVWKKKLEAEGMTNLSRKEIEKRSRQRIFQNVAEMEELKRNREARQSAKEDMEMINREQERSQYSDWRRLEDQFHLNQAKLRSQIRIQEGRAKPIDLLGRYIAYKDDAKIGDSEEFELNDPLSYLKECSYDDFEDLLADIPVYRTLDGKKNVEFWDDIKIMAESEKKKLSDERKRREMGNVHPVVENDFLQICKGKTYPELEALNDKVQMKIESGGKGVDVSFYESFREVLKPFMAKQRLKELHSRMLKLRLRRIREEQSRETVKHEEKEPPLVFDVEHASRPSTSKTAKLLDHDECDVKMDVEHAKIVQDEEISAVELPFSIEKLEEWDDEVKEQRWQSLDDKQVEKMALQLYQYGGYSPRYGEEAQAMPGIEILDEVEDRKRIDARREELKKGDEEQPGATNEELRMIEAAKQGMGKDETSFTDEATIDRQTYLWSDKYRPRKPRYFNRVHTGFDWNKYNQTHYDIDNPPPKIVQGYRFNIFYPDLLDPSVSPTFKLTECDDPDFAILHFKCGPPYEDIAFKIVNREWETNHKHGYKCQFQNGVFQLWFFFKRYRYRR